MLLNLFLTNILTILVAVCVGLLAEAEGFDLLDKIARVVAISGLILLVVFGYYAIWQL